MNLNSFSSSSEKSRGNKVDFFKLIVYKYRNGSINDNYIEIVLNLNEQELFDCNSYTLEMKMKIIKPDGGDLD